jgi:hypothetical protein
LLPFSPQQQLLARGWKSRDFHVILPAAFLAASYKTARKY